MVLISARAKAVEEVVGGGVELANTPKRMKALLVALTLVLSLGCASCSVEPNLSPNAEIAYVAPVQATEGQTIVFVGFGTDNDGNVVGYLWQSDRDGELSRVPSFETNALSVGQHRISFLVQDNNAALSEEVQCSITVSTALVPADIPLPDIPPQVRSFSASEATIEEGESTTLAWDVANASMIVIDQGVGTVSGSGSITVSPEGTTTYTLIATGGGATATARVTITVQPPPEPLPPFWIEEITVECDTSSDCAISPPVRGQDGQTTTRSLYICSTLRVTCEMGGVADDVTFEWMADGGKIKGDGNSIIWVAPGHACKALITVIVGDATGEEASATLGLRVSTCGNCFEWPGGKPPDPRPSC